MKRGHKSFEFVGTNGSQKTFQTSQVSVYPMQRWNTSDIVNFLPLSADFAMTFLYPNTTILNAGKWWNLHVKQRRKAPFAH